MYSVIQEIEKLRGGAPADVQETPFNRYTVLCREHDRTKTAYCFGIPIRTPSNDTLVDLRFHHSGRESTFAGTEATVSVADSLCLMNRYGQCDIALPGRIAKKAQDVIDIEDATRRTEIRPTPNGVLLTMNQPGATPMPCLTLRMNRTFPSVCTNGKYFAVMREKHIPFVTVSCLGVLNAGGKITAPCEVRYEKKNDSEYVLLFSGAGKGTSRMAVEINLQETKLFQDTTVESGHPEMNNAFGGVSFLGNTDHFGEQWLYARLVMADLPQLRNGHVLKAVLHIPNMGLHTKPLTVHRVAKRFCSFRSDWQNKIPPTDKVAVSTASGGYYHLDMTKLLGNFREKSENYVIRANPTDKPVVIPTGDSFYAPQILEVKFQTLY